MSRANFSQSRFDIFDASISAGGSQSPTCNEYFSAMCLSQRCRFSVARSTSGEPEDMASDHGEAMDSDMPKLIEHCNCG